MPVFINLQNGSKRTWAESGADAALTLTALAAGAYRQGETLDLGDPFSPYSLWEPYYQWALTTRFASAPTQGDRIKLYLVPNNNTSYSAGLTGSDGAFTGSGLIAQLERFLVAELSCDAVTTEQHWVASFSGLFRPTQRYVVPVVHNAADQALSGTASHHELSLTGLQLRAS